ncbi:hypothetical protein MMC27_003764 [Xylographa pallens]|nr:hypothetical protein [Xylographa pallens]
MERLGKVLKKSTASATSEEESRDEIDVFKLELALWPFIKPQMEICRRELQRIKKDIIISCSSYMTQVGTDAERKKFTDDLPRVQRTRALARQQVREAKEHQRRQTANRHRKSQHRPSVQVPLNDVPPEHAWGYDVHGVSYPAEEEQRKAYEEAERKPMEEQAVRTWNEQQIREVEVRRQMIEVERSPLRAELTNQRVSPQQIEDIINRVHPQEQINGGLQLLSLTPASSNAVSVTSGDNLAKHTSSRRWSIWLGRYVPSSPFGSPLNPGQKVKLAAEFLPYKYACE